MPVTPTDELALAVDHLRQMIASSASFQAWVGAPGNATTAALSVYMGEAPGDASYPLAVVWLQRLMADRIGAGGSSEFDNAGMLGLQLVHEISDAGKSDAYVSMLNAVGGIRKDLLGSAGGGSPNIDISTLNVKAVYRFDDANAAARAKDVYVALLEVSYTP